MKYILQILISFYLLFSFQFLMLFIQTDRLSDLLIIETLVDFSFQITSRAEVSLAVRLKMFSNILFIFFHSTNFHNMKITTITDSRRKIIVFWRPEIKPSLIPNTRKLSSV